jgi:hypothetical protein
MSERTAAGRGAGHAAWIGVLALVAACGARPGAEPVAGGGGTAAANGRVGDGRYARADIERALEAELAALAELDERVGELEAAESRAEVAEAEVVALRADRVARAGFAADLARCLEGAAVCPPTLDEPTPPATWDPASDKLAPSPPPTDWTGEAARLERAACGCRTADCAAWVLAELARWEAMAPPSAASDRVAGGHVTGARGCLSRRLGR